MTIAPIVGGEMVSILAWNDRDIGSILVLCAIFHMVITPHDAGAVTRIPSKLCDVWLLNLPCLCEYLSALPVCMQITI